MMMTMMMMMTMLNREMMMIMIMTMLSREMMIMTMLNRETAVIRECFPTSVLLGSIERPVEPQVDPDDNDDY